MKRTLGIIECNYSSTDDSRLTQAQQRPLASLPFHGRYRLVDFPLSNMANAGVPTIGLIMPNNYRSLIDHVGSGKDWGLVKKRGGLFIQPGVAYGTARKGGRFLLSDLISNKVIFTRNDYDYVILATANFVFNIDYDQMLELHKQKGADITMLTSISPCTNPDVVSVQVEDGRVTGTGFGVEEGQLAFLDSFIINRETLFEILGWYESVGHLDLFEALANDFGRLNVQTTTFEGFAIPIFSKKTYYSASRDLLDPTTAAQLFKTDGIVENYAGRSIKTKSHDTAPAKYQVGCKVSNSLVSSSCIISGTVEGSVLCRQVIVEPGAVVEDSIIMQNCVIEAGAVVKNCIIDRNNIIPAKTEHVGTKEDVLYITKASH